MKKLICIALFSLIFVTGCDINPTDNIVFQPSLPNNTNYFFGVPKNFLAKFLLNDLGQKTDLYIFQNDKKYLSLQKFPENKYLFCSNIKGTNECKTPGNNILSEQETSVQMKKYNQIVSVMLGRNTELNPDSATVLSINQKANINMENSDVVDSVFKQFFENTTIKTINGCLSLTKADVKEVICYIDEYIGSYAKIYFYNNTNYTITRTIDSIKELNLSDEEMNTLYDKVNKLVL